MATQIRLVSVFLCYVQKTTHWSVIICKFLRDERFVLQILNMFKLNWLVHVAIFNKIRRINNAVNKIKINQAKSSWRQKWYSLAFSILFKFPFQFAFNASYLIYLSAFGLCWKSTFMHLRHLFESQRFRVV